MKFDRKKTIECTLCEHSIVMNQGIHSQGLGMNPFFLFIFQSFIDKTAIRRVNSEEFCSDRD